jgi:fermentation-respiration switch protein FrsA (DUF1100 family)
MRSSFLSALLLLFALPSCSYLPESELEVERTPIYEETSEYIRLGAATTRSNAAFLFVPGGLVDPHAYLQAMEKVVEKGIDVVILKVSANLAILDNGKPERILRQLPDYNSWYVGGHSLGGISALAAVRNNPDLFEGLILLGTYPTEAYSIPDWKGNALSLYAEFDQLSTPAEINASRSFLPLARDINAVAEIDSLPTSGPLTLYYLIAGGNHAQFGQYGAQAGDGEATISAEAQHEEVGAVITAFINWNESL